MTVLCVLRRPDLREAERVRGFIRPRSRWNLPTLIRRERQRDSNGWLLWGSFKKEGGREGRWPGRGISAAGRVIFRAAALTPNLFKSRAPAPSECSSLALPAYQPLADRSCRKTLNDLVARSTSPLCRRDGEAEGLRWDFARVRFVVSRTRHIYICLAALVSRGQTGKKKTKTKRWHRLFSESAPEL